jgi:hypothetical protein
MFLPGITIIYIKCLFFLPNHFIIFVNIYVLNESSVKVISSQSKICYCLLQLLRIYFHGGISPPKIINFSYPEESLCMETSVGQNIKSGEPFWCHRWGGSVTAVTEHSYRLHSEYSGKYEPTETKQRCISSSFLSLKFCPVAG